VRLVVAVPDHSGPRWVAAFRAARPAWEVAQWQAGDGPRAADYAAAWAPGAQFFADCGPFKAVFNLGAGVDALLALPALAAHLKGAPLIRLNDAGMAAQMAEYVCHAVAREVRGFAEYEARQRARSWQKLPAVDKADWPVGVMGLGSIGRVIACALAGFDYPVHGWSRNPACIDGVVTLHGPAGLEAFLRASRILVVALPLTAATRHLIDARAIGRLRDDALLINVGRGALIDDAALLAALDAGHVRRAFLDVFETEPLPPRHAFWTHPRVTLTPHVSGSTLIGPSVAQIVDKIGRLERGETVEGVVDLERGY
jgi:glyoxylate/hydroxypyruvate reductase A